MANILFYTTSSCHLCNLAEELLIGMIPRDHYTKMDISESESLFDLYAERIPVLRKEDGTELSWPFNRDALNCFLSGEKYP